MYIVLSDAAERKLRLAVVMRLGGKKGNLSAAIEEAIWDWLKKKPKHHQTTTTRYHREPSSSI